MALDSQLMFTWSAATSVTQTGATTHSDVLTLSVGSLSTVGLSGTPRRGMVGVVNWSAATNVSGSNNVFWQIDHSDNGTNFVPLSYQLENPSYTTVQGIALTTTAQEGVANIPFNTDWPYIRLTGNIAGAGSTPTVTYAGGLSIGRPN